MTMKTNSIDGQADKSARKNIELIALVGFLAVGMIYGALLARSGNVDGLALLTDEYADGLIKSSVWISFKRAFSSAFIFILIPFLLGFSAIGAPFAAVVPFFRGLGLGCFMANMYLQYGVKGIGFCAATVLPYIWLALFCTLLASREAVRLSAALASSVAFKEHKPVGLYHIKLYCMKFGALSALIGISSAVYCLCVWIFSGLFKF